VYLKVVFTSGGNVGWSCWSVVILWPWLFCWSGWLLSRFGWLVGGRFLVG